MLYSYPKVYDDSLLKVSAQHGPLSIETQEQLQNLDKMVENFMERMEIANMQNLVNFIIMSDHGMTYGKNPSLESHQAINGFLYDKYKIRKVSMEEAMKHVRR